MFDVEMFTVIKAKLELGWPLLIGATVPTVAQKYQPQAEGMGYGPILLMTILDTLNVGHPKREALPALVSGQPMRRRERQACATPVQITALFKQDPDDLDQISAQDLARQAVGLLQSDWMLGELRAAGLAIERIGQVRNTQFVNGADEFEASPSFDFVLTHEQVTVSQIKAITGTTYRQFPV